MAEITMTVEQLYQQQIKSRPVGEQLRLVILISQQLTIESEIKQSIVSLPNEEREVWQNQQQIDNIDNIDDRQDNHTLAYYQKRLSTYQANMENFESQYKMSTETFYQKLKQGQLEDHSDFAEWANLLALKQDIRQKTERAKAVQADPEFRKKRSLLTLERLGTAIWQEIDAQTYVNQLRDEWDDRL